jgi:hypothetical protein
MGEAKRRGEFEERKAKAIALRTAYCGKRVKSSRFGDGVIRSIRHDTAAIRFTLGRRTVEICYPTAAIKESE